MKTRLALLVISLILAGCNFLGLSSKTSSTKNFSDVEFFAIAVNEFGDDIFGSFSVDTNVLPVPRILLQNKTQLNETLSVDEINQARAEYLITQGIQKVDREIFLQKCFMTEGMILYPSDLSKEERQAIEDGRTFCRSFGSDGVLSISRLMEIDKKLVMYVQVLFTSGERVYEIHFDYDSKANLWSVVDRRLVSAMTS